jgi:protein-tyrosine phosphatase
MTRLQREALYLRDIVTGLSTGAPRLSTCQVYPHLYVGGQHWWHGWETMKKWGITAVVNMRMHHPTAPPKPIKVLRLPTLDHTPPKLEDLKKGADFIREEIEKGGRVYVHCREGRGRGPTMAAAYLVSTGMVPDEAWETIRKARPFINPTRRQREQLLHFAETLKK